MSIVAFSIASSFFWIVVAILFATRKRNALHVGLFFALLFVVNYPVKLIATEFGFAVIDSAHYGVEWQIYALWLSNLSALLFAIPLFIGTRRSSGTNTLALPDAHGVRWLWLLLYIVLIFGSYGLDPILRLLSRAELRDLIALRGERRLGSAFSAIALQTAQISLILFCLSLARHLHLLSRFRKYLLLAVGIIFSYALLGVSGSKNISLQPFAFFILAYNWVRCMRAEYWGLKKVVSLGVVGLVLLTLTGYLRGFAAPDQEYPEGRTVHAVRQLMAAFDAPDNLTIILYQMDDVVWGDMNYAPTLDNLFLSIIPRAIWRDKPLLLGNQKIMAEYIPERFTDFTGEVLAPSMPGEMIVSGGIVFMVFASIMLGLLYTVFYRLAHTPQSSRFSFVLYCWLTLNTFNLLRSGTGIVGPFLILSALCAIILWVASLFAPAHATQTQAATHRRRNVQRSSR